MSCHLRWVGRSFWLVLESTVSLTLAMEPRVKVTWEIFPNRLMWRAWINLLWHFRPRFRTNPIQTISRVVCRAKLLGSYVYLVQNNATQFCRLPSPGGVSLIARRAIYRYTSAAMLCFNFTLLPAPDSSYVLTGVCLSVCLLPHVKTTDRIFMKILSQKCLWTHKSPVNSGSHPGPQYESWLATRTGLALAEDWVLRLLDARSRTFSDFSNDSVYFSYLVKHDDYDDDDDRTFSIPFSVRVFSPTLRGPKTFK